MVFQHYALFPNMNVLDNVKFGLEMKGVDKKTRDTEAKKMIDLVGLTGKEDAYPANLSGGQQQRVAIARALVSEAPGTEFGHQTRCPTLGRALKRLGRADPRAATGAH